MDSHGSASPIPPASTGATSRSAGGATVTRRRQTEPPEIPEFRDIEQLPDGRWRAVHDGGTVVTAPTLRWLEYVTAPAARITDGLRRS